MKKMLYYITTCLLVALVAVVAVGCRKTPQPTVDAYQQTMDAISASLDEVKVVDAVLSVTDQEVLVYRYRRTVTVYAADSIMVNTAEQTLASTFGYVMTQDSVSLDSIDRVKLLSLDLAKDNLGDIVREGNTVSITIPQANFAKVMGQDVTCREDATLILTFEEEKLQKAAISVLNEMEQCVTIEVSYQYE